MSLMVEDSAHNYVKLTDPASVPKAGGVEPEDVAAIVAGILDYAA